MKLSALNIRLGALVLIILIIVAQCLWLWKYAGFPFNAALSDALISYLLLLILFWFTGSSFNYYLPRRAQYLIIPLQSMLFTLAWLGAVRYLLRSLIDVPGYDAFWEESYWIRGLIAWILLCDYTAFQLLSRHYEQKEAEKHKHSSDFRLRQEAELFKLRQQLHPHFLFNSLNSINALIGRQPEAAREMLQTLSAFLRNTLTKEDKDLITFKKEYEDLQLYLKMERMRFGHRLQVEERLSPECQHVQIPPFLLQPLLENAIKYGLYGTIGEVWISITAECSGNLLKFTISNPFDKETVAPRGTGFGIASIQRRLYLLFGQNNLLQTKTLLRENQPVFVAQLTVPISGIPKEI